MVRKDIYKDTYNISEFSDFSIYQKTNLDVEVKEADLKDISKVLSKPVVDKSDEKRDRELVKKISNDICIEYDYIDNRFYIVNRKLNKELKVLPDPFYSIEKVYKFKDNVILFLLRDLEFNKIVLKVIDFTKDKNESYTFSLEDADIYYNKDGLFIYDGYDVYKISDSGIVEYLWLLKDKMKGFILKKKGTNDAAEILYTDKEFNKIGEIKINKNLAYDNVIENFKNSKLVKFNEYKDGKYISDCVYLLSFNFKPVLIDVSEYLSVGGSVYNCTAELRGKKVIFASNGIIDPDNSGFIIKGKLKILKDRSKIKELFKDINSDIVYIYKIKSNKYVYFNDEKNLLVDIKDKKLIQNISILFEDKKEDIDIEKSSENEVEISRKKKRRSKVK